MIAELIVATPTAAGSDNVLKDNCERKQAEPLDRPTAGLAIAVASDPAEQQRNSIGHLTPEMRAEIENELRRSSDGLSHGATFRLREQGLSDAEIAARRGVSVATTRKFQRSLDALLNGTLPTSKSAAEDNSYVYRELLNHHISEVLRRYVMAQLSRLKEINPAVTTDPLNTRTHQYRVGMPKRRREGSLCPCGMQLSLAGTCDYCD